MNWVNNNFDIRNKKKLEKIKRIVYMNKMLEWKKQVKANGQCIYDVNDKNLIKSTVDYQRLKTIINSSLRIQIDNSKETNSFNLNKNKLKNESFSKEKKKFLKDTSLNDLKKNSFSKNSSLKALDTTSSFSRDTLFEFSNVNSVKSFSPLCQNSSKVTSSTDVKKEKFF